MKYIAMFKGESIYEKAFAIFSAICILFAIVILNKTIKVDMLKINDVFCNELALIIGVIGICIVI